jgi:hypothetical protein
VVKQLCALTELNFNGGYWSTQELRLLLSDGDHSLQRLEKFNLCAVKLDVETVQMLMALPALTELQPWSLDLRSFPLLRSWPNLRTLCLLRPTVWGVTWTDAAVAELLSSLRMLSCLSSLELGGEGAEVGVLLTLMEGVTTAVPQLRGLKLNNFRALPLLTGLRACTQLRSLQLELCDRPSEQPVDDIQQLLQSLRFLERVAITKCRLPLADSIFAQLPPPSVLVPSLKQFRWWRCM